MTNPDRGFARNVASGSDSNPRSLPNKKSRRKKAITDEERINIALDRFGGHGKFLGIRELGGRYGRNPTVISRAISEAFSKGLVVIGRSERNAAAPQRCERYEQELKEKFDLLNAIVVDTEVRAVEGTAFSERVNRDRLHAFLGHSCAEVIAGSPVFRDNDKIAIGPGRGCFYTIEALRKLTRLRPSGVTLISLTGNVDAADHARIENTRMDADTHVNLIARCFAKPVNARLISSRIAYENLEFANHARTDSCIGRRWQKPTHALVGVGVLKEGHSFFDFVDHLRDDQSVAEHVLFPLRTELCQLVDTARALAERYPDYCPVADVANRLFVVPPPKPLSELHAEERKKVDELLELVKNMNGLLVNADTHQLSEIETMMVVAGTRHKATAIHSLLLSKRFKIRLLCTDKATAERILTGRASPAMFPDDWSSTTQLQISA